MAKDFVKAYDPTQQGAWLGQTSCQQRMAWMCYCDKCPGASLEEAYLWAKISNEADLLQMINLPNETERELDAQIEKIEQLIANKIEAEITKNITE